MMKEQGQPPLHPNSLIDKYKSLQASILRRVNAFHRAKEDYIATDPTDESRVYVAHMLQELELGAGENTDRHWVHALLQTPEITSTARLTIWERKDDIVRNTKSEETKNEEQQLIPSSPASEIEDLLEEGTPHDEISAQFAELQALTSFAKETLNTSEEILHRVELHPDLEKTVENAVDAQRRIAENETDVFWIQVLGNHPFVSEKLIVELLNRKNDLRSKYDTDFTEMPDEESE